MLTKRYIIHLFQVLTIVLIFSNASAQISPGKLSSFHQELEGITNCAKCHNIGQKRQIGAEKCLECHTQLKSRIDDNSGYHSSEEVKGQDCTGCHSEHHGREYELVFWPAGKKGFDHTLTSYKLENKHSELDCNLCHKKDFQVTPAEKNTNPDRTFLGLKSSCLNCHWDEHQEQLGNDCLKCHNYAGWKPAGSFNHDLAAYKLTGMHKDVDCVKCHKWENTQLSAGTKIDYSESINRFNKYKGLEYQSCVNCHKDPHESKFGNDCQKCHNTSGFERIASEKFDHGLTSFPLRGLHSQVECNLCHKNGVSADAQLSMECSGCHVDEHRGQFINRKSGNSCELCHSEAGFLPANYGMENHNKSEYPLTGSHQAIPCFLCHTKLADSNGQYSKFHFESTNCKSCHNDVHKGQLDIWINKEGCEFCHSTETWHKTSFDHKLSRFALEGKHREILCLECHHVKTDMGQEVWIKPLSVECNSCHTDIHEMQFSELVNNKQQTNCQRCHTSNAWKNTIFNHDADTKFPLTGGHNNVECLSCHKIEINQAGLEYIVYSQTPLECAACHAEQQ